MTPFHRRTRLASPLLACAFAINAAAQSASPNSAGQNPSPAPPSPQKEGPKESGAGGQEQAPNPKRILDIIPNFGTTNDTAAHRKPMTPREKYGLAWHQMFDFSAHLGNAFQASIQQATDGQPHFGQGWSAYGKRFAAAEGDQVTSAFFIYGFFPHLLKQDPRYFRQGSGGAWHRLYYAISRTAITRKDSGEPTFNTSQIAGQLVQQGFSNLYYPQQDRNVNGTLKGWGVNLAYNSGYNSLKEYFPDFLRLFHHRRAQAESTSRPDSSAPSVH